MTGTGNSVSRPVAGRDAVLDWADVGRFAEAISFARKELFAPVQGIRERHGLGPRGIWIIGLIANGRVRLQSDIARLWQIGRSMVTEEVTQLVRAGLVLAVPDESDRRQVRLSLTAPGREANEELGGAFADLINGRLAGYRPEDIELCIRLLRDLAGRDGSQDFARSRAG
ncbi:MAG: winged helix-turn-helix transcriptional regulator [Sphingomonadales bacterium]|nr:winged helix-turn-helix transcriptional regulator [Sphingomonadales bacterium]